MEKYKDKEADFFEAHAALTELWIANYMTQFEESEKIDNGGKIQKTGKEDSVFVQQESPEE